MTKIDESVRNAQQKYYQRFYRYANQVMKEFRLKQEEKQI